MAAAVEELPEELMTLILVKLPVKSLLRFKCVQKSWYSLIKSPQFARLHRCSSSSSSTSSINYDCFVVRRFMRRPPLEGHVLSLFSYETLGNLGIEINIPIPDNRAWLCGSCDGMVCITNYKDQILICNPTIRELRSLFVPPEFCERPDYKIESVAFGSDQNTGKYTVLMIGVPISKDYDDYRVVNYGDREARLYDFRTDSWRETAVVIPPGPFEYSRCAILFNGAFHWSPVNHDSNILSFHISNEVTESIPLPVFFDFCHASDLFVSSQSQLSLILHAFSGWFEICVMTEYGVKESWSRLLKIGPLPHYILRPTGFWGEQQLLLKTKEGYLVSCDLQNQNLRHFPIGGGFDLYPFSQSLVSVNGIGRPII